MKKCIQSGSFPGPAHCCLTCPIRLISPAQNVRTKEFRTFFFYDNNTQHQIHFAISARLQINTSFHHGSQHSKRFSLEIKRSLDQRAFTTKTIGVELETLCVFREWKTRQGIQKFKKKWEKQQPKWVQTCFDFRARKFRRLFENFSPADDDTYISYC